MSGQLHGEVLSFYVEADGRHVVMTVSDPSEDSHVTVRVSRQALTQMADAGVQAGPLTQAATPVPGQPAQGGETR